MRAHNQTFWLYSFLQNQFSFLKAVCKIRSCMTMSCPDIWMLNSGWTWWSQRLGTTNDMENSRGQHTIWRSKRWNRMQSRRTEHLWAWAAYPSFYSENPWLNWHPYWCSSSRYGHQLTGFFSFVYKFTTNFVVGISLILVWPILFFLNEQYDLFCLFYGCRQWHGYLMSTQSSMVTHLLWWQESLL